MYGGTQANAIDLLFNRICESAVPANERVGEQAELFGETLTKEDIQNLILEKYGKQTNYRGNQAEPVVQSVSGNRQDNETTAARQTSRLRITEYVSVPP